MKDEAILQRAIDEEWGRHRIGPGVDVFDDWYLYLVEGNGIGRCAYCHSITETYGEGTYGETQLEYGEFDRVLSEAILYLNQRFEELSESASIE